MNENVKQFVIESIRRLINNTANDIKINKLLKKHNKKMHFIPIRYRIFGGLLQSMNIQFGNFIEELLHTIVENEENLQVIEPSGNRSIELPLTTETDRFIDEYITERQNDINFSQNILNAFNTLIERIFKIEKNNLNTEINTKHDIDVLFKIGNDELIYLEGNDCLMNFSH